MCPSENPVNPQSRTCYCPQLAGNAFNPEKALTLKDEFCYDGEKREFKSNTKLRKMIYTNGWVVQ